MDTGTEVHCMSKEMEEPNSRNSRFLTFLSFPAHLLCLFAKIGSLEFHQAAIWMTVRIGTVFPSASEDSYIAID